MQDSIGGFTKEDGYIFGRITSHFCHMIGIILADTIDAPDRKNSRVACHGDGGNRFGRNQKVGCRHGTFGEPVNLS